MKIEEIDIKTLIKSRNKKLKKFQLAEEIGATRQIIWKWENMICTPSISNYLKLVKAIEDSQKFD